jgi:hypothetical protein
LQVFVWLPIVMSWRAMTTTSDSGPARSGIGVACGSAGAVPLVRTAAHPASPVKSSRPFGVLAAILPD